MVESASGLGVSRQAISLARFIDRLPDGKYMAHFCKIRRATWAVEIYGEGQTFRFRVTRKR